MANYISTLLSDFQTKAQGVFSEIEMREKQSQLLPMFMKNPTNVIPNYEALKTSDQRAGAVDLLVRKKVALGTNRQANHTGAFGDSLKKNLTWKTYQRPFKVSLKQGDRNVFDNPAIFDNQLKNAILDIHDQIDTDIRSFLALQKSQVVNTVVGDASWNAVNFAYDVAGVKKDYFYQILKSAMRANGHKGSLDVVADSVMRMTAERLFSNGTQNATNTSFQASGLSIFEDHFMTDANYAGTTYAIPEGAVVALPWIPKVNRNDYKIELDGSGNEGTFTKISDPLGSGLVFAVHYKRGLADTNALGGEYQDVVTEFEISVDIAYETAPLSTANESAIIKFGQL